MASMEFQVDPHWAFLGEQYDADEAFAFFGPYLGAHISVHRIDSYTIETRMPLVPNNRNYVGTHFGGSLYAMCDPFYMFLLIEHLGPDYIVWDKGARIDFQRPGKGLVRARFHIPESEIDDIRSEVEARRKTIRLYTCRVVDEEDSVVTKIEKELYIRKGLRSRKASRKRALHEKAPRKT